jgi:hypothetical protein
MHPHLRRLVAPSIGSDLDVEGAAGSTDWGAWSDRNQNITMEYCGLGPRGRPVFHSMRFVQEMVIPLKMGFVRLRMRIVVPRAQPVAR